MATIILQNTPTKVAYGSVILTASPWTTTGDLVITTPLPKVVFRPPDHTISFDIIAPIAVAEFTADTYTFAVETEQPTVAFTAYVQDAVSFDLAAEYATAEFTTAQGGSAVFTTASEVSKASFTARLIPNADLIASAGYPAATFTTALGRNSSIFDTASGGASATFAGVFNISTAFNITAAAPYVDFVFPVQGAVATGTAVAVNLANFGNTEYTNYGFSQYIKYQGSWYGILSDGMYLLEDATDSGTIISASFTTKSYDMFM
jgi:hypothetical protein